MGRLLQSRAFEGIEDSTLLEATKTAVLAWRLQENPLHRTLRARLHLLLLRKRLRLHRPIPLLQQDLNLAFGRFQFLFAYR